MQILIFNVGSSSIKYSLFQNKKLIISNKYEKLKSKSDYIKSFNKIKESVKKKKVDLIIHRVVHGGEIKKPSRINSKIKNQIKKFSQFAPLHNPKQLLIINLAEKINPKQYAVFDTQFFSKLPKVAKIYPIPKKIAKKYSLQKYGFHGLSHKSVSENLKGKTITCHLGAGISITAIKNKISIDTTMGLTPNEGIIMATRSGNIDSGLVIFLEKKGFNTNKILNTQSGLKAISGFSDFRKIIKNLRKPNNKLAYEILCYQITKQIGAYTAALNGLNNLVFTGPIGENVSKLRKDICSHLEFLKIKLDKNKNLQNKEIISSRTSKVKVYVRKTNEEKIILNEVLKII
ncbi:acetate kinase [archaeon]|jgi:acetate kinase|nr:acetate kinase [archaeon]MBT4373709.1 acetate kinase [archaeon]MBT4531763.1 acetate kinase [archaeon]MBT7001875.1 acetate kinase [archaeon]MBT7281860.1 acetate kinase [archaeon]